MLLLKSGVSGLALPDVGTSGRTGENSSDNVRRRSALGRENIYKKLANFDRLQDPFAELESSVQILEGISREGGHEMRLFRSNENSCFLN